MSMSTHVVGFVPPDAKWKKMKAAWDACTKAGVPVPEEVTEFFNYEAPDSNGVEIDIKEAVPQYRRDMCEGFDVDVSKLPKHVSVIRFYNSW